MREKRSQMLTKSGSAAVKEKKPWKWYNHMIFLSDHISFRPTQSNFELPIRVSKFSGLLISKYDVKVENYALLYTSYHDNKHGEIVLVISD